jgi:hypothetical protein
MKKSKVVQVHSDFARTPASSMAPKESPKEEKTEEDKLRSGEYDLEHLMKAHDIQGDNERMEYVHRAHAKKSTAMKSIADLKMAGEALAEHKRVKTRFPKREK